jgi:hypothetical protein
MSLDFAALTQAVVAGLSDVRSCVIVSRDGLVLGASPANEEGRTLDVWTRIAELGDVERGFVSIRDEVWVFCRRGAYGAVATAASTARPGVILDTLEQMVLTAEESRVRKEGLRLPSEREPASADTPRGLRTALHRDRTAPALPEEGSVSLEAQEAAVSAWAARVGEDVEHVSPGSPSPSRSEHPSEAPEADAHPPTFGEPSELTVGVGMAERRQERPADDSPVDPVELSREFAAILEKRREAERGEGEA